VVRNENYWQKDADGNALPYLDEIEFRVIGEDPVRVVELQAGNADLIARLPGEMIEIIRNDPDLEVVEASTATAYRLYLNMREPPFNNTKLRQAINYAFDREIMATTLMPGQGYVAPFMILPSQPEYSEYTPYNYDPEKAKRLMAEAGYPDGLDIEFMLISREPDRTIAPVVQSYLEAVGIRTTIQPLDRLIYIERGKAGNFELGMAQITLPLPSIFLTLSQQLHSDGPVNRAAWKNAQFDALLDKLATTFDPEEQKKVVAELQRICLDDAGQTFLFHRAYHQGKHKKVKDFESQYEGTWRFHRAWLDE
jgi:ABC-type transport system substrate-binding protein